MVICCVPSDLGHRNILTFLLVWDGYDPVHVLIFCEKLPAMLLFTLRSSLCKCCCQVCDIEKIITLDS